MTENAPVREVRVGLRWVTAAVVVLALAAGAAWWFRLLPPLRSTPPPPQPWLSLTPAAGQPTPAAAAGGATPAKIKHALLGDLHGLTDPRIVVAPLGGGVPLFAHAAAAPSTPASLNKVLTAAAALAALGPETTFATTTTLSGSAVTLVGGGDPLLASTPQPGAYPQRADLQTLAASTAAALKAKGLTSVQLTYDASLWQGPLLSPHWPGTYQADGVVAPISPLWVDEGRTVPLPATVAAGEAEVNDGLPGPAKVKDPAAVAAAAFAKDLAGQGITVTAPPAATSPSTQKNPAAEQLAQVRSAPLRELLQWTLELSDNEAAETIAHHVGLAVVQNGSFEGGVAGVTQELQQLGVDTTGLQLFDGSGLSRDDRVSPLTLVTLVQKAASDPRLSSLLGDLPTAGWSGSLADRFSGPGTAAGRGVVRAKTGTLTGVDALAGTVVDGNGDALAFAVMASGITNTLEARQGLDRIGADLAACACR